MFCGPAQGSLRNKSAELMTPIMKRQKNNSRGKLVLYQALDGTVELDVRLERDTLWLSQKQMSTLFDKDTDTIGLHLRNIFEEGELEESATTEESSVVQKEGNRQVRRSVRFYNLDAIISVGYRVNSKCGTQFRIWATKILRDHIIQGYTVNERRLRQMVLGSTCPMKCFFRFHRGGSMRSRHMLSATCHLSSATSWYHALCSELLPNATSALEPKMVHNDPQPRYSGKIVIGVLYFVAPAKAHGKRYGI